jgi:hypothetical protein
MLGSVVTYIPVHTLHTVICMIVSVTYQGFMGSGIETQLLQLNTLGKQHCSSSIRTLDTEPDIESDHWMLCTRKWCVSLSISYLLRPLQTFPPPVVEPHLESWAEEQQLTTIQQPH